MGKIFDAVFPMMANRKANMILRKKMSPQNEAGEYIEPTGVLVYVENSDKLSSEILKEQYEYSFKTKDKLEDKAKTNIIGITISITLIIGASGMLSSISEKFQIPFIAWLSFLLFMVSVAYMLLAGLLVIRVLTNENEAYIVKLTSLANGEEILRDDYDKCIAQNQMKNTIRNNYVFTSYACIRNALVCLFVIFLFVTIPFKSPSEETSGVLSYSSQAYSFMFTSSAIDYITEYDVRNVVESAVINVIEKSEQSTHIGTCGIIDVNSNLFIKYEVSENYIRILLIEPYITP
jgi:hypothetical protein